MPISEELNLKTWKDGKAAGTPATSERDTSAIKPTVEHVTALCDFKLEEPIAWGSLASVVPAVDKKSGKRYAIKILNKRQLIRNKMTKSAHTEREALTVVTKKKLPGNVYLHFAFQDDSWLYFVLDLAPNGDLKALVNRMGSLSLRNARYYTALIVDAVRCMHDVGVVHRDLKPENVLLDQDMRIKLCDFGCAYVGADLETWRAQSFVGTAAYISPELIMHYKSSPKSPDMWGIGCTLYFMLFGKSPFMAGNPHLCMKKVKALDFNIPESCDEDAKDLIQKLLVHSSHRLGLTPNSSLQELQDHPFFIGHKSSLIHNGEPSPTRSPEEFIDWKNIWETPPPEIISGSARPQPREQWEDDPDRLLWTGFANMQLGGSGE